ncbi:MAG: tetratricopeptide repeat protein [Phycisphaerae bacterium]
MTRPLFVFAAAVAMGLPTLRGSFVGGDDYRLVLNHVLVNHPSVAHALELFKIIHRDLYQPLPMLSFSLEFALANALGLFARGWGAAAWFFHLTNTVLHAVNAVLVWYVIVGLQATGNRRNDYRVGTIAALLFAVHPLQVEVVAWVNGRMMLLSTMFALASLLALGDWLRRGRRLSVVLTLVFTLCCAISKIRVALPLLFIIVPLAQGRKIKRSFVVLWAACVAITCAFVYVNLYATREAGVFEGAAEKLHGPSVVRAILALAWYFQHLVWPTGLASWYPAPGVVRWSDGATLRAVAVTVLALSIAITLSLRSRSAALGFAWFFVSIASTIQIVPTRNALAADRYMYLPIIGLFWVVGQVLAALYRWAARRRPERLVRGAGAVIAAPVGVALLAVSWHTASFYEAPIKKSRRIAMLAPTTPHVWERVAWACYRAQRYEDAITYARRELDNDDRNAQGVAYQAMGMAQLRLGNVDEAFASLTRAVEIDPQSATAKYHLAVASYEQGRIEDATRLLEQAVEKAPLKNPWLIRLATLYRAAGRTEDARALYERALQNNPYEVPATLGLAESAIETGTREGYLRAERDLLRLLEWMPENVKARVNLGIVYNILGRTQEAITTYQEALKYDARSATAALNLAALYFTTGDLNRAAYWYEWAASMRLTSIEQLAAVHDFFVSQQAPERAVALWSELTTRVPESADGRAYLAWARALAGEVEQARSEAEAVAQEDARAFPIALCTLAYSALAQGRFEAAAENTEALCELGGQGAAARHRLLGGLAAVVRDRPDDPWSFCLAGRIYECDQQDDNALPFIDLCDNNCHDEACKDYVRTLRQRLKRAPAPDEGRAP